MASAQTASRGTTEEMLAARPWLKSYPPTVPAELDEASFGTLVELFRNATRSFADRPAYESFGKRITYGEFAGAAEAVASWLQAQGLRKGDRVAIMMPNVLAYPAALFGVLLGGYTVVNVNPLYTPRELTHQLNDAGVRMLFVLENFAHVVEEALPNLKLDAVVVVSPGDLMGFKGKIVNFVSRHVKKAVRPFSLPRTMTFASVLAAGRSRKVQPVAVAPDDIAFLQYTGGTTGVAKGAILTHRNVAANVTQLATWLNGWVSTDGEERHVMVVALPLYHIFALTVCCMMMLRIGACGLLIANPRDIPGFIKTLKSTRFTMMCGVNTLYNAIANNPDAKGIDFSAMVLSLAGGMATQAAVAKRWRDLTDKPIVEGYGLSETSPVVCANRLDIEEFTGTIGFPLPSTEVAIRAPDNGDVPHGEVGELCVRGPQVMAGYWHRPDETAKVMTEDGFFRTGDLAVMGDDGSVRIVDRMKDMVLVSGFNVYPNEVEDVLVRHPKVLEAAVIGLPDEHSGEAVAAYVVRRDESLTEDELRAYARENLTAYKVPRHVVFRESLPKTNVGKVLRRELRDQVIGAKRAEGA
ncbi:AMP-binding protein [Chelatococcus sp. SYSU_G07232]|uniref:Long-chain-fatty-acid--CoA ligase n=1 Tax=Chelatococcus albus TaxID=3047466 RepID=A0ABT7AIM9_9HYPH|nr:AMP-binding protein [Chelatococcus sp. SYSU_G07232]MDJ1159239.1 AMP-binding protein [Chelatococcus sp. SYSU_G07232]